MAFVKSSKRLLIKKQEMVLIKASQEVQNTEIYGNLYDCLESYDKISEADLDKNVVFDDKARIVLINPSNKKQMMEKIQEEWYSIKNFEISDSKTHCQLCGRINKYIFYIKNRHTDIELHIGSDCVKNYPDITGIKQQQKELSQLQKEQKMQQRKIEFEAMEGKEVTYISDAENRFKNFPVLLPFTLHERMKEVLQQINLTKISYIKSGGDLNEIFQKYTMLKKEFEDLYAQAHNHYKRVKDNLLVCNKSTSDWLQENNYQLWKKVAKNNGIFDNDTLKGIYDDMLGDKGETFILTEQNNLYLISQRSNSVQFLLKDVKDFQVKYDNTLKKEVYLILDTNNILSLYFFDNNTLKKHDIYDKKIDNFYYVNNNGKDNVLINQDNKLSILSFNVFNNDSISYENVITYSYLVAQSKTDLNIKINSTNIEVDKIIEINDKYFYLKNNNVYELILDSNITSNLINFENKILDIYATGEDACIAICNDGLYYLGTLENYQTNYEQFNSLNINKGKVYGNRNSVILLDNNQKLYLNKQGKFVGMYKNIFTTIILRYVSIFVLVMVLFYIILSFIEDNKRYNRY